MAGLEFDTTDFSKLGIEYKAEDPSLCTVAHIEKYYAELKQTWDIGEQQADQEGNPVVREYSVLRFSSDVNSLDFIQLDYVSDEYEGDKYYRVTSKFYETEYYSAKEGGYDNFSKWEVSENEFIQEIIYKHAKVGEIVWDRPYTHVLYTPAGQNTGDGSEGQAIPIYNTVPPTAKNTGLGSPVTKVINNKATLVQYNALDIPFKRLINCGNALAATVTSDATYKMYLKSSPLGERQEIKSGVVVLRKQYLEIEFEHPTQYNPSFIRVEFYGSELWRSFAPIKIDHESEVIVHNSNTPQIEKYKPPGKSDLPDNFWNNRPLNQSNYENFINRQGVTPSWESR